MLPTDGNTAAPRKSGGAGGETDAASLACPNGKKIRDNLGDELPFWQSFGRRHHPVIPTSYETKDNRFDQNSHSAPRLVSRAT